MNTDNAAMILAPTPAPRQLSCARCGVSFACGDGGRDGGCWCADEPYRLPMPGAAEDCLCPTCLRTAAAKASSA